MTEIRDHGLDAVLAGAPGGPVVKLNLPGLRPDGRTASPAGA